MNIGTTKLQPVISVGLDVHKDSIWLAAVEGHNQDFIANKRFGTKDLSKLRKFLVKLAKRGTVRCVYEASFSGYHLRRLIVEWGFHCEIAATSLIPTKPGERKKCDRLDAEKLANYLRGGLLTLIHVPTAEHEAARDLVRCRRAVSREVTRWKNRMTKFLATKGVYYRDGETWSNKHLIWLERVRLPQELDNDTLRFQLDTLAYMTRRLDEVDAKIKLLSEQEPFQKPVRYLRAFRGIETYTAMVLVTELGDIRRFPTPRKLMAYTGLVPSVHQSGNSGNKAGSITKTGNSHLRHVLIQAAWNYAKKPCRSRKLRARQKGAPAWLLEHTDKAQKRLYSRYHHLCATRDRKTAVVAVARELIGFIGAALVEMAA